MKVAGAIVASVFNVIKEHIVPGVQTKFLDKLVYDTIVRQGASPSFLHYGQPPFPASACISLNEEVVHGIPGERILQNGDIVSVDVGACYQGYHGDACRTFLCGEVTEANKRLVQVTTECFFQGLAQAQIGKRLGDISSAVQAHAEAHGYGVVRELFGHGIGRHLHEDPNLLNYGTAGRGIRLEEGMCLALEPMITAGHYAVALAADQWTFVTVDGSCAAHYENTFVITKDGPQVLTLES